MRAVLEQKPLLGVVQEKDQSEGPQRRLLRGYLHKTSNGLCGIKGYASLIAETGIQEDSSVRWARKIIIEVERMEAIFRSVGDLSHPRNAHECSSDLVETLENAAQRATLRHPGLEIETGNIPNGDLLLPAADLGMILDEILNNSAESSDPDQDTVRICIGGTVGDLERVILTIEDDGPGIEKNLMRHVADPFVTTRDGHLGIGLTRIETILDMYGLAWDLVSEQGFGTTITLEVGILAGWMPDGNLMKRKAGNG